LHAGGPAPDVGLLLLGGDRDEVVARGAVAVLPERLNGAAAVVRLRSGRLLRRRLLRLDHLRDALVDRRFVDRLKLGRIRRLHLRRHRRVGIGRRLLLLLLRLLLLLSRFGAEAVPSLGEGRAHVAGHLFRRVAAPARARAGDDHHRGHRADCRRRFPRGFSHSRASSVRAARNRAALTVTNAPASYQV
jgi:hypothetical protein